MRRPTLRYVPTQYGQWWRKPLAVLALIALAPLLAAVAVRAVMELAEIVVAPLVPYAVVILALAVIYRLMFRRRL